MSEEIIQFLGEAAPDKVDQGQTLRVFSVKSDDAARKALSKKAHDVISGVRSLKFAVEAIQKGYRFDDQMAQAKIASMERAIQNLEKEAPLLQQLFMGK